MSVALALLAVVLAAPALFAVLHLTTLTVGSLAWRPRREPGDAAPIERLLYLVPAHDEVAVIAATLRAIGPELGPEDRVLVVADHCSDATADVARRHGADVLERHGPDGPPGRAEARQAGIEHAARWDWDAVCYLDADSRVAPGFRAALVRGLRHGPAVQARSEAAPADGIVAQASVLAFAMQGVTLPRGRDRLGLAVRLRGTGMALRRELALTHRFRAAASEDLVLTLDLVRDGVRPVHVDDARLVSQSTRKVSAAGGQRLRWEAGRLAAARNELPALLRRPTAARIELATHLVTPPLAVAIGLLLLAVPPALLAGAMPLAALLVCGLALLATDVVVALVAARAPVRAWLALATAPWYVGWKLVLQARALATLATRPAHFPATPREEA